MAEGEGQATGGVQFLNLGHIAASLITSVKIWARPHLLISVGQLADGVEDTSGHAMHAVHDLQRQLDAGWKIATIELIIAVWAIHRRRIPVEDLGAGVRDIYDVIRPFLPINTEGDAPFSLAPVIDAVKNYHGINFIKGVRTCPYLRIPDMVSSLQVVRMSGFHAASRHLNLSSVAFFVLRAHAAKI